MNLERKRGYKGSGSIDIEMKIESVRFDDMADTAPQEEARLPFMRRTGIYGSIRVREPNFCHLKANHQSSC